MGGGGGGGGGGVGGGQGWLLAEGFEDGGWDTAEEGDGVAASAVFPRQEAHQPRLGVGGAEMEVGGVRRQQHQEGLGAGQRVSRTRVSAGLGVGSKGHIVHTIYSCSHHW